MDTLINMDNIKALAYASLISADNDRYTEDQKQESMYRYELEKTATEPDWEFILEPFGVDNRIIDLFK